VKLDESEEDSFEDSFDICEQCFKTKEKSEEMVNTKQMQFVDFRDKHNYMFHYTDFKNMLSWFPILSDQMTSNKMTGTVYINLDREDANYEKICLQSADSHGRTCNYILYDEQWNLENVLLKLREICADTTCEFDSPIVIMMNWLGIPYYEYV
jgi:hypothetical protein